MNPAHRQYKRGCCRTCCILVNYIYADTQKKQSSFKIGLFTVFIVVTFLSFLQSAIQLSSVVFVTLAQNQVGEIDLILQPVAFNNRTVSGDYSIWTPKHYNASQEPTQDSNPTFTNILLNHTEIQSKISNLSGIAGVSPRWVLYGKVQNAEEPDKWIESLIYVGDSKKQLDIGIGKGFQSNRVLGPNQAIVTESALRLINVNPYMGDTVNLKIDVLNFLQNEYAFGGSIPSNLTIDNANQVLSSLGLDLSQNITVNVQEIAQNITDLLPEGEVFNFTIPDDPGIPAFLRNLTFNLTTQEIDELIPNLPTNLTIQGQTIADIVIPLILPNLLEINIPFSIVDAVQSPDGKWGDNLGNVFFIDSNHLIASVVESLERTVSTLVFPVGDSQALQNFFDSLKSIKIDEYAMTSNVVFENRIEVYSKNSDERTSTILQIGGNIALSLGLNYNVTYNAILNNTMSGFDIIRTFLDTIFASIVFFLLILSIMLIYSLMMANVDQKTYEFGMLRSLGLRKTHLIGVLLLQATLFIVPGVSLGLLAAYVINVIIRFYIFTYTNESTTYQLHYTAIIMGLAIGTLMPLAANVGPIMRALSRTLRDALDVYHRVVNEFTVQVIKLEKRGISLTQIIVALMLITIGVLTYYVAPASFLYDRVDIFLFIMNLILICMILGLTFIALLVLPFLQALILIMITKCCCRRDKKLHTLVVKNLKSHERRNIKTSLMFSVALSFIIFAGCSLQLQGDSILNTVRSFLGSDLFISSFLSSSSLNENQVRPVLERFTDRGMVSSYTFTTRRLDRILRTNSFSSHLELSPLCGFPRNKIRLYGVQENFLNATFSEYYYPSEFDPSINDWRELQDGSKDAVWALYQEQGIDPNIDGNLDPQNIIVDPLTVQNSREHLVNKNYTQVIKMIVPSGLKDPVSIRVDQNSRLRFQASEIDQQSIETYYQIRIRATAQKMPGFFFSGYQQAQFFAQGLVSMPQFSKFINTSLATFPSFKEHAEDYFAPNSTYGVGKERLLVRLNDNLKSYEREEVINAVRSQFTDDTVIIIDVKSIEQSTKTSIFFLQIFFVVVGAIGFALAFFLLLISTTANIKQNVWELGVIRAIGVRKDELIRLCVYESFVVTTSAVFVGVTVGIIVAVTLTLQFNIFIELPFRFVFPYLSFFLMVGGAMVIAFVGAYIPAKKVSEVFIANILKGSADM